METLLALDLVNQISCHDKTMKAHTHLILSKGQKHGRDSERP
jgi:hypothetical protein